MIEPDAKMGRITVPARLLESIGVAKDVIFSGNDHKIELWAKEKFEESRMDNAGFISLAEKILG